MAYTTTVAATKWNEDKKKIVNKCQSGVDKFLFYPYDESFSVCYFCLLELKHDLTMWFFELYYLYLEFNYLNWKAPSFARVDVEKSLNMW